MRSKILCLMNEKLWTFFFLLWNIKGSRKCVPRILMQQVCGKKCYNELKMRHSLYGICTVGLYYDDISIAVSQNVEFDLISSISTTKCFILSWDMYSLIDMPHKSLCCDCRDTFILQPINGMNGITAVANQLIFAISFVRETLLLNLRQQETKTIVSMSGKASMFAYV